MWQAMRRTMQVSKPLLLAVSIALAPCLSFSADEEVPDDEFLEFLGAWDEAWSEACDPEEGLPEDESCLEYDDDEQEITDNES